MRSVTSILATAAMAIGAVFALPSTSARAEGHPILDRVRAEGILHCGGVIRPGLAFPASDGWHGLEVDVCHAVAVAVLGPDAKFDFSGYALDRNVDPLRKGEQELAFLTGDEMRDHRLTNAFLPGPPVFFTSVAVMVQDKTVAKHVAELSGTRICVEPGTWPEDALEVWFGAKKLAMNKNVWQEAEEMMDAFNVGRCPAVVQEETVLAALRLTSEASGHSARILPDRLDVRPVFPVTRGDDPAWTAIVTWTVQALIAAETRPMDEPIRDQVPGAGLGIADGWARRINDAVGGYSEIFERSLGATSPLDLARGLNASWRDGGLIAGAWSN